MNVIRVVLRNVGSSTDSWKEDWKGRDVQDLEKEEVAEHVASVIEDWNSDHPDNQRTCVSFEFIAGRQKTVAEKIVDEIISDLSDRRGLRHEWDQIDDEIKDEVRDTWIDIVNSHMEGI